VADHEYALPRRTRIDECAGCGTLFQDPMPRFEELGAFYPPGYHSMGHRSRLNDLRNGMRWKRLEALIEGDGAVLDYGCGSGTFLEYAAEQAPQRTFYGYEIGDKFELTRSEDGRVTIIRGTPADLLQHLPACSLITLNHVIEHLPDPLAVLQALGAKLLPGGIFEGQTPSCVSYEHWIFGSRWSGYHAPRHTVIFSPEGMKRILARAGCQRIEVTRGFNPAGLAVSLGSLPHGEKPGRVQRRGLPWLFLLAAAGALLQLERFTKYWSIMNFQAVKSA
jgi:SAM-dependent methyltransferase